MPDKIEKTETVYRTYDDHGNLTSEVTTVVTTRTPEPGAVKPRFGFTSGEKK